MALPAFLDYLRFQKRYSENTLIAYEKDIQDFQDFLLKAPNSKTILDCQRSDVRSWMVFLVRENRKPVTIARKLSSLKSFYKFCLKKSWIKNNPAAHVQIPEKDHHLPDFVEGKKVSASLDEREKLAFEENESPPNFREVQELMVVSLLFSTGMRESELINLKPLDIDFWNNTIKVLGKGNKQRLIPLPERIMEELREYLMFRNPTAPSDPLFITVKGKKIYPMWVYRVVHNFLTLIQAGGRKSPHILRHSFATQLLSNGADLQAVKELLGHASLAATQVYTHNSIEKLREIFQKTHPKA